MKRYMHDLSAHSMRRVFSYVSDALASLLNSLAVGLEFEFHQTLTRRCWRYWLAQRAYRHWIALALRLIQASAFTAASSSVSCWGSCSREAKSHCFSLQSLNASAWVCDSAGDGGEQRAGHPCFAPGGGVRHSIGGARYWRGRGVLHHPQGRLLQEQGLRESEEGSSLDRSAGG